MGSSRANVISVDRGDEVVKLVDTNEIYRIKSINEECREILGESLGKRIRYTMDMQTSMSKGFRRRKSYMVYDAKHRENKRKMLKYKFIVGKTDLLLRDYTSIIKMLKKEYKEEQKADPSSENFLRAHNKLKRVQDAVQICDLKSKVSGFKFDWDILEEENMAVENRMAGALDELKDFEASEVAAIAKTFRGNLDTIYKDYRRIVPQTFDPGVGEEEEKDDLQQLIEYTEVHATVDAKEAGKEYDLDPNAIGTVILAVNHAKLERDTKQMELRHVTLLNKQRDCNLLVSKLKQTFALNRAKQDRIREKFSEDFSIIDKLKKKPARRTLYDIVHFQGWTNHALGLEKLRLAEPLQRCKLEMAKAEEAKEFVRLARKARKAVIKRLEQAREEIKTIKETNEQKLNTLYEEMDKIDFVPSVVDLGRKL